MPVPPVLFMSESFIITTPLSIFLHVMHIQPRACLYPFPLPTALRLPPSALQPRISPSVCPSCPPIPPLHLPRSFHLACFTFRPSTLHSNLDSNTSILLHLCPTTLHHSPRLLQIPIRSFADSSTIRPCLDAATLSAASYPIGFETKPSVAALLSAPTQPPSRFRSLNTRTRSPTTACFPL